FPGSAAAKCALAGPLASLWGKVLDKDGSAARLSDPTSAQETAVHHPATPAALELRTRAVSKIGRRVEASLAGERA
ncbi:MAG TPA: hypothetical protein VK928_01760, partial [Longimicrobiales bacterium]|nr:hypothetical protein [Longimicrobiales bacterium]